MAERGSPYGGCMVAVRWSWRGSNGGLGLSAWGVSGHRWSQLGAWETKSQRVSASRLKISPVCDLDRWG
ncbi:hypothetical protein V6N11_076971 [Hibiscus sabdariffa]|uniref:Uncharacterized protein n=1 Tax=Hibiscus sabdariffa TaxID=183260 RepID=A0ABR2TBU4_9ROSI